MNGVSKKLCMTAVSIVAISQLAAEAPDKLPYAVIIGVICIFYKVVQGFLDWRKAKNKSISNDKAKTA